VRPTTAECRALYVVRSEAVQSLLAGQSSTRSLALAAATVCHCILLGASAPPCFIHALNTNFAAGIPPANIEKIASADPLVLAGVGHPASALGHISHETVESLRTVMVPLIKDAFVSEAGMVRGPARNTLLAGVY
jgi:hypothetical protein